MNMRFVLYWLPLIAFAGFIFWLSSIPGDGLPPMWMPGLPGFVIMNIDKMIHAILYGFFGWLSLRAFALGSPMRFPWVAFFAFLITIGYGATDELHQAFVSRRSCDIWDWVADAIGSFSAILILSSIYKKCADFKSSSA